MICKYCGKEIPRGRVWNPDRYGNGYHYKCLVKMDFDRATEVKTVPLDRIKKAREEMVNGMPSIRTEGQLTGEDVVFSTACECYAECIMILDKLIAEVEGKE